MEYKKGQVVLVSRIKFADNNRYDHASSRPTLIPIASDTDSDETYYLTLTHNIGLINVYPTKYFDLTDIWKEVNLKEPSLINLQNIYIEHVSGSVSGGLDPRTLKDVIRALKAYQEEHPCANYEKVKNKLK